MSDPVQLALPDPESLGAFFWEGAARGELLIQRCDDCGTYIHYPRPVCRVCLSRQLTPVPVSGDGTVRSFTIMVQAFHPFFADKVPYAVASVELTEQKDLCLITNLHDCSLESIQVGMPVKAIFSELIPGFVIPQFRPAVGLGE